MRKKTKTTITKRVAAVHFMDRYLLNPPHQVTVDLIGLGGTGSKVLQNIARMNHALKMLGHPGLHVRCWDPDEVSEANAGRQLFSPADVGLNKAIVLVSRVNAFFGSDWEAMPEKYRVKKNFSNITITCVDTAKARVTIGDYLDGVKALKMAEGCQPYENALYWMDIGNLQKTGQVVMGTLKPIGQPNSAMATIENLPTVIKKFPELKKMKEENQGPSCSLAEALSRQDLFINSVLAEYGVNLLWRMFREAWIKYHGVYVNLDTMMVNPIPIWK
jgi:PRTRC genetic system ThiF family protein